jgi:hypothetical protein
MRVDAQAWRHACELFDNYLLACFVLFSGVTLEMLAWQVRAGAAALRCALSPASVDSFRLDGFSGCR